MAQRRVLCAAVMVGVAVMVASCTGKPDRVDSLPPSCPGSDTPAYAYTLADDGGADIFGLRPDGDVVELTSNGGSSSPSFTPDGKSIVYARADPAQSGGSSPPTADSVWTMESDGSNPRELLRIAVVRGVSISRDGTRLALIGQQRTDRPDRGVYVAGIDGSDLRRVYSVPNDGQVLFGDPPAWSPDGSEVAVTITANGRVAVYAISTDDGAWRSVTEAESVSDPAWSADGSTISFLSSVPRSGEDTYEVFTVAAAGGEARRTAIRADALDTATTDGSAWLVQRSQEQDQWEHQLVLVDDAGEIDQLVLPPLEMEYIGAAALAPCALE